ncbi:triose-phosphate isomerase [Comamonas sp. NLF-1-9]|uniref:triose-phosphate isomerase n=1 Tax=Comamonas sp. NLF-1-9 TaxID=2853163 RepID=UPI001C47FB8A|nr:triose-phosphate isomerase [Comamonas sp. NLF-1-9]QXL84752.1 triose-phosphate isomerase [Comamonas sp. NLF-1-9]
MSTRPKFIAGNWKMNASLQANAALLQALRQGLQGQEPNCRIAVAVPAPYLAQVGRLLQGSAVALGAQDVSRHDKGAYTGEVSAAMLADFGVRYCLVGHSERRQYHGESDADVAAKAARLLAHGITPVVCVGETLAEREAGQTLAVVQRQLDAVLSELGSAAEGIVAAYEPVWAIGTGRTATPEQAQQVHAALRGQLVAALAAAAEPIPVLYGGSMNPGNAPELLAQGDIDGGLIGGAALKAEDFLKIISAAQAAQAQ